MEASKKKEEKIIKEQAAKQAPVPPQEFIRPVIEQSRAEPRTEPGEHRDRIMAEFAGSEAWKLLKQYLTNKRNRLEKLTRSSVRQDQFDLQATGFRYLIFDQLDAFVNDIINHVENVAKILEMKKEVDERPSSKQR
jgi:hypothetical protein